MDNTENKGGMPNAELMARMIQAQFGSPEQSDAISKHMEEYFKRFPSYKHKFTNLEWYHIFLDFSDHLQQSSTDSADRIRTLIERAFVVGYFNRPDPPASFVDDIADGNLTATWNRCKEFLFKDQ